MRITREDERNFKKDICIFTENLILGQFSVSAWANQVTGFRKWIVDFKWVIPND